MRVKTSHVIYLFWTSNTIFWMVSIAVICFNVYFLQTAPQYGTQPISYFLIGMMTTVFMIGFSGCCGGVRIHLRCLHLYVVLIAFFCVEEAVFLIFMLLVGRQKVEDVHDSRAYLSMSEKERSDVQSKNQCCGHDSFMDYLENYMAPDPSCFSVVETSGYAEFTVHTDGCKSYALPWLMSSIKVYSGFLIVVFVVKFMGLFCAVILMKRIKRQKIRQLARKRKNTSVSYKRDV